MLLSGRRENFEDVGTILLFPFSARGSTVIIDAKRNLHPAVATTIAFIKRYGTLDAILNRYSHGITH